MDMETKRTYVTLLSSDDFIKGVIMLHLSLKAVNAQYPLFVLCSDSISKSSVNLLKKHHLSYKKLSEHISVDTTKVNVASGYDHWNRTFDKLYVWTLTEYDKVVYLDSDMQVVRNIDFLFDKPHMSAVIADQWNEPGLKKLNSGLIVIEPNVEEFDGMKKLWESGVINLKNVGDQDIIRDYYSDWETKEELHLLPSLNVFYSEVSAGIIKKKDVQPVSVIHYIGSRKPWMVSILANTKRMRNNFLGKKLLAYIMRLYVNFPILFFQYYKKNARC